MARRRSSRSVSLNQIFLTGIIVLVLLGCIGIYVFSSPSLEEQWKQKELVWIQKENEWEVNYQIMKEEKEQLELYTSRRFIDQKTLDLQPYTPSDDHVIVTLFGTDDESAVPEWINALIMFQSLHECKSRVKRRIALSYRPLDRIPVLAKNSFSRLGVELRFIGTPPRIPPSDDWSRFKIITFENEKRIIHFVY